MFERDDLMDERKKQILKAIVDDYVETAEPVGSKSLVERHQLKYSSATIRHEMAELEEMGYLEKPHTSAGRMPSDKGYRAYVDNLLSLPDLSGREAEDIRDFLLKNLDETRELIERAAEYLAGKTDYLSVALSPQYSDSSIEQIKIMMIEPGRAIVVLVLSAGVVHDRLIRIPAMLDEKQLDSIGRAVERCLAGKKLDDITLVTISSAADGTGLPEALVNQVLFEAYVAIKQTEKIEIFMDGKYQLLKHPEFKDVDRASRFYQAVHQEQMVAGYMMNLKQQQEEQIAEHCGWDLDCIDQIENQKALTANSVKPSYMVRIGQEIALEGMDDMSFITTTYRLGRQISGQIGVIGPKRMAYGKIIAQISFVNKALTEAAGAHHGQPVDSESGS
ncbi:MAG: heat-inducible transcriptional repressor HrcA [Saccharofermentanales bacterium]